MDVAQLKDVAQHCGGTFVSALACVHVYNNEAGQRRVQAGNGRYCVDAPCDLEPLTVDAGRLLAALSACRADPTITVTEKTVTVKAGKVRARLPLDPTPYPLTKPVAVGGQHIADVDMVLKLLEPFAAEDASRPWATSICLNGAFAYATNNVALVRHPLTVPVLAPVNIPGTVVPAVVQRGAVVDIGCDGNSVTFYYADGSWVNTGLITGEWPTHVVDALVGSLVEDAWEPVHESLSAMLTTAAKISTEKHPVVELHPDGISLTDGSFDAEDLGVLPASGRVGAKMAALALGVAEHVQWHTPRQDVHAFRAGSLVGVLGGTK